MLILSGDIGGTNTRLQLVDYSGDSWDQVVAQSDYCSGDYSSLTEIIKHFLESCDHQDIAIDHACFAVAGPVVDGAVKFTNLPWLVDEASAAAALNVKKVKLINDFTACAYGLQIISDEHLIPIQSGKCQPDAISVLMGAGTGLGVALMQKVNQKAVVNSIEGGHVDFAPTGEQQVELFHYLRQRHVRVSLERVLSGYGLVNIYKFIRDNPIFGEKEDTGLHLKLYNQSKSAEFISEYALTRRDPMAFRALDMFIRIYGASAGNLALNTLPFGGFYICGGMALNLASQFQDGRFMKSFLNKGRMSNLLQDIPVKLIVDPKLGLKGAAFYAARVLSSKSPNELGITQMTDLIPQL